MDKPDGSTVLHIAANCQTSEGSGLPSWWPNFLMDLVRKCGPILDSRNKMGKTALHLGSAVGNTEMVKALLYGGACPCLSFSSSIAMMLMLMLVVNRDGAHGWMVVMILSLLSLSLSLSLSFFLSLSLALSPL